MVYYWQSQVELPEEIETTIRSLVKIKLMFPNIHHIKHVSSVTPVTACTAKRANSAIKFIKVPRRATMQQKRFNALVNLFIHRDIVLDKAKIIDIFVNRHPRRMSLINLFVSETD